jgi:nucleotide-binding universal stress UspA family protein
MKGAATGVEQRRPIMTDSITRILVPVDFSGHSDRALRYAAALAGQVGASVELLHVVEDVGYGAFSEVYVPSVPDVMQEAINAALERLALLKAEIFPHGSDVESAVYAGRPPLAIVEHAAEGKFDLIVMGTHGRTGLSHLLIGSVAEHVARMAPCPVLTVRAASNAAASASASAPQAA